MAKTTTRPAPVSIPARGVEVKGDLVVPADATGVVLFAHGSGSSRLSPRNRFVAEALNRRGLATLLADLLTASEEEADAATAELRFDIPFLAGRLDAVSSWLRDRPETRGLPLGYFGASTGAAAALLAAAARPSEVFAVVSRGGRPDLAVEALALVKAPTLLLVGGEDREVLAMNEVAASLMTAERRLEVVPGATHLFEERGALESVARLAGDWFLAHLPGVVSLRPRRA
ncbi:MAG: dienelactone hydrolase family protein [Elusimicrobia bacterium]|nr:dienelactone hydrolase family protein [Elusimicrobiota bacterium]